MRIIIFELGIQTDHTILTRVPDAFIKKITYPLVDFAVPANHSKNKRIQNDRQLLGSCLRTEKVVEHESDSGTNCLNYFQRDRKENGGSREQRKNRNHPDHNIVKISFAPNICRLGYYYYTSLNTV